MTDAKRFLDRHLSEDDYEAISAKVAAGYAACVAATQDQAVLGRFLPGMLLRSWLITPFVDHSLIRLDGFHYEFRRNAARNWFQTTLTKKGLVLTSHYLGGGRNRRSAARKAVVRAELNHRNADLFGFEGQQPDSGPDFLYCHLLHGGYNKVDSLTLAIPNRDQSGYVAAMSLPMTEAEPLEVEEIKDELLVNLITFADIRDDEIGE